MKADPPQPTFYFPLSRLVEIGGNDAAVPHVLPNCPWPYRLSALAVEVIERDGTAAGFSVIVELWISDGGVLIPAFAAQSGEVTLDAATNSPVAFCFASTGDVQRTVWPGRALGPLPPDVWVMPGDQVRISARGTTTNEGWGRIIATRLWPS